MKQFAGDIFLSSIFRDQNISADELKTDLEKISNRSYQLKRGFNADSSKQDRVIVFSHKVVVPVHLPLIFSSKNVSQERLDVILDELLTLEEHFKTILSKMN